MALDSTRKDTMAANSVVIHTVSLYQEDWDIIQRESNRLRDLGSAQGISGALRHIVRDWHRLQTQISVIPEATAKEETPCSPSS